MGKGKFARRPYNDLFDGMMTTGTKNNPMEAN
jgi:hypothetical protein